MKVPLLVIAGPTGVGKTDSAVALAARLPIEVVSADSRQVYRGMDVATGKPSLEQRRAAPHHLIDVADPDDRYHAARFRGDAAEAIDQIRRRGRFPVVVGGTGLYIRALLRGLDAAPPADPGFRRELELVLARDGRVALHDRLQREAPEVARRLHPNDHVRVVRALERVRSGGSMAEHRWTEPASDYRVLYVGLTSAPHALAERLRLRVRAMIAAGLLDEVRALLARGYDESLPAMCGIGYREFVAVARGDRSEDDARRLMERATLQYVRRQWTWFAREPDVRWIDAGAGTPERVAGMIEAMAKEEGMVA